MRVENDGEFAVQEYGSDGLAGGVAVEEEEAFEGATAPAAVAVAAPDLARAGIESVDFMGMRIDNADLEEVLRRVTVRIAEGRPGYVVTPNVDHICRFQRDPAFALAYADAFLSLVDGTPVLWAARLFGTPFKQKLSGSDMIYHLCALAEEKGFSVYLLGGPEGVAEAAARCLRTRYPALSIAGHYCPPMRFEQDPREKADVIGRLRAARPDICFVALSSPRQELWMWRNYRETGVPVMMGIGGALDFVCGRTRRAPVMLQRAGLEWFWRLCMEPRRLWRRYLVYDRYFLTLVARHLLQQRRGRKKTGAGAS